MLSYEKGGRNNGRILYTSNDIPAAWYDYGIAGSGYNDPGEDQRPKGSGVS